VSLKEIGLLAYDPVVRGYIWDYVTKADKASEMVLNVCRTHFPRRQAAAQGQNP